MYSLLIEKNALKKLSKLARRDLKQATAVDKAVEKILKNPYSFKPLKKPMQGKRRVHVGSFVLTYAIDEKNQAVKILDYAHHDKIYKQRN